MNIPDNTLDRALGKNATRSVCLCSNGLFAYIAIWFFDGLVSEVVTFDKRIDDSIVIGNNDASFANNVEVLGSTLPFLSENLALFEGNFSDKISKPRHFVRLEMRVCEDRNSHEHPLLSSVIDEVLEWAKDFLKGVTSEAETCTGTGGRDIGPPRITSEKSTFTKPVPGSQDLIDVATIAETNVVNFDRALTKNVEDLPDISLVDDALSHRELNSRERIRDLDEISIVKF
mmetsp:Transcript_35031/g.52080  ORF Transcript_35031/g.52080 Transcript_35031/m.52080 type:complete len:230 (-) Transcript_35031:854-1543(-)